jgi:hypothetical protein
MRINLPKNCGRADSLKLPAHPSALRIEREGKPKLFDLDYILKMN